MMFVKRFGLFLLLRLLALVPIIIIFAGRGAERRGRHAENDLGLGIKPVTAVLRTVAFVYNNDQHVNGTFTC